MHSEVLLSTMHVQVRTLDRCCEHQRTHLLHARYRMCIYTHVCAVCFIQHWGIRIEGFNQSIKELVAWHGGLFLTEGKIGVLSASSLFLKWVGVYEGVCVCIRARTHTLHRWGTRCEPRSRDETPGGPENPDGLNLGIHIFVYVYKVHMCICILRGGMRSWTNCCFSFNMSFLLRKVEDVTTISKPQSLTSVRIKDCTE